MTPWFKTFLATIFSIMLLFCFIETAEGKEDSVEKQSFKMCLVSLDKDKQTGCWVAKSGKVLPFEQWLKQADPKAVYIKTLVPTGGGIAKVFYKESQ